LLVFSKFPEPNTRFALTLNSVVRDGFGYPSQLRTATVFCAQVRNCAVRHCRYKSTLAAWRMTTKTEPNLKLAKVHLAIPCKQQVAGLWQLPCNLNGDWACANGCLCCFGEWLGVEPRFVRSRRLKVGAIKGGGLLC